MAVETKPVFHPEVIRQQLGSFTTPESVEDSTISAEIPG
jgi:hypothetical protein